MPVRIENEPGGCRIDVRVVPGSRRAGVVGPLGDRLKVKVAAPPEDGRANAEVRRLLAAALGVPDHAVTIAQGHARPEKQARIAGLGSDEARRRLGLA
ncbi:MAG: DUF167 domain-containing protein [Phycisphaerae bacterium]|nr:DUF167 domain-containing protein [Phycisphaerae bacterium]